MGLLSRLGRSRSPSKALPPPSFALNPSTIVFPTADNTPPLTVVLQHMGENMCYVCWKVRRADPKVVSLRPHRGVLKPGESIEVQVWLKDPKKAAGLIKPAKVAFKCLSLREGFEGGEDEMEQEWEKGRKKNFTIKILEARFVPPGTEQSETETETEDEKLASSVSPPSSSRRVSFRPTSSVIIGEQLEPLEEGEEEEGEEEDGEDTTVAYGVTEVETPKTKKKGGWFRKSSSKSPMKSKGNSPTGGEGSGLKKKRSFFSRKKSSSLSSSSSLTIDVPSTDEDIVEMDEKEEGRVSPFLEERLRDARRDMREAEEMANRILNGSNEEEIEDEYLDEPGDYEEEGGQIGKQETRAGRRRGDMDRLGSLAFGFGRPDPIDATSPGARNRNGSLAMDASATDKFARAQEELRQQMIDFVVDSPTEMANILFEDEKFEEGIYREGLEKDSQQVPLEFVDEDEGMTFELPDTPLGAETASNRSPSSQQIQENEGTSDPKKPKAQKSSWFSTIKEKKPKSGKDKKKKWFSMKRKKAKNMPEDPSVAESSVLDFDDLSLPSTAPLSPPESTHASPPTVSIKNLSEQGAWGMTIRSSMYISYDQLESFLDQCEEITLGKLVSDGLMSLTLVGCNVVDMGWLGDELEHHELSWHNLSRLEVTTCGLEFCHSTFSHLERLTHIDLRDNSLTDIPRFETPFLETLILRDNKIPHITRVDHLTLSYLDLSNNKITTFSSCREIVTLSDR